jgi:uncharacterized membrane protein YoaK (UPF0700 family)
MKFLRSFQIFLFLFSAFLSRHMGTAGTQSGAPWWTLVLAWAAIIVPIIAAFIYEQSASLDVAPVHSY